MTEIKIYSKLHFANKVRTEQNTKILSAMKETALETDEVLLRETLSNQFDAVVEESKNPLKANYKYIELDQEQSKEYFQFYQVKKIIKGIKNLNKKDVSAKDQFEKLKKYINEDDELRDNVKIPFLVIEDYNTYGLNGSWFPKGDTVYTDKDRYLGITENLYNSEKTKGFGSYGLGRIVHTSASLIYTAIYYSRFNKSAESDDHSQRLIGLTNLPSPFADGDITKSPFGLFSSTYESSKIKIDKEKIKINESTGYFPPFVDDETNKVLEKLKLDIFAREKNQFGTTILIPFCDVEIQYLCNAYYKYFWPSFDDDNDISFFNKNEKLRPEEYILDEIKPFRSCHNNQKVNENNEQYQTKNLDLQYNKRPIKGAYKICSYIEKNKINLKNNLKNSIAILRNDMVINYFYSDDSRLKNLNRFSAEKSHNFYGLAIPNKKPYENIKIENKKATVSDIIRKSEPPTHDDIKENQHASDDSNFINSFVRNTYSRIDQYVEQRFANLYSEKDIISSNEQLVFFKKRLSFLFKKAEQKQASAPENKYDKIHYSKPDPEIDEVIEDGSIIQKVTYTVALRLNPKWIWEDSTKIKIHPMIKIRQKDKPDERVSVDFYSGEKKVGKGLTEINISKEDTKISWSFEQRNQYIIEPVIELKYD